MLSMGRRILQNAPNMAYGSSVSCHFHLILFRLSRGPQLGILSMRLGSLNAMSRRTKQKVGLRQSRQLGQKTPRRQRVPKVVKNQRIILTLKPMKHPMQL